MLLESWVPVCQPTPRDMHEWLRSTYSFAGGMRIASLGGMVPITLGTEPSVMGPLRGCCRQAAADLMIVFDAPPRRPLRQGPSRGFWWMRGQCKSLPGFCFGRHLRHADLPLWLLLLLVGMKRWKVSRIISGRCSDTAAAWCVEANCDCGVDEQPQHHRPV